MTVSRDVWLQFAACRDVDPAIFFPTGILPHQVAAREKAAKDVCNGCLVRQLCLDEACRHPSHSDEHGVRGGMTPEERKAYRIEHNIEPDFEKYSVRGVPTD